MEIDGITVEKAALRKTIKARLAALSPEIFTAAGRAAALHLPLIPRWDAFRSVLIFLSLKDEIDTRPIMEAIADAGKSLFTPREEGQALGFYRIISARALRPDDFPVLILSPGLAFDRRLNRLGRGRGCYDRFFASLDSAGRDYTPVGLCMDCQLVDEVPVCLEDKRMEAILTESGITAPAS